MAVRHVAEKSEVVRGLLLPDRNVNRLLEVGESLHVLRSMSTRFKNQMNNPQQGPFDIPLSVHRFPAALLPLGPPGRECLRSSHHINSLSLLIERTALHHRLRLEAVKPVKEIY
jgi:hypothetical protein